MFERQWEGVPMSEIPRQDPVYIKPIGRDDWYPGSGEQDRFWRNGRMSKRRDAV